MSMGALGILDRIIGVFRLVESQMGTRLKDWGRYAAAEPLAAAHSLELIAVELTVRAKARRRQNGWVARRLYARAAGFKEHVEDLRDRKFERTCPRDPYRDPGR
jgi:hypothetical protein